MKYNVERPDAPGRHHPPAARRGSRSRRTAACGSARWSPTPTPPTTPRSRSAIRCCRQRDPGRRLAAAAQRGDHRRQPAASARAATISTTTATPCNKREPGSGCRRIGGVNRIHAILGASEHCIATHPSDMCVALAALEADGAGRGPGGRARASRSPTSTACRATRPQSTPRSRPARSSLAIDLPAERLRRALHLPEAARPAVLRLRAGLGRGGAARSTAARSRDGAHRARRRRPQAVARRARPRRCCAGKPPTPRAFAGGRRPAARAARRATAHNDFKIELARRAIVRALTQAAAGTPQSQTDKRIA